MAIRVIVVEDESGIRKLLRKIIERNDGFEVAGECDNLADAVSLFARLKPEVVFLDIEINGASGIDCAKIIADMEPKTKLSLPPPMRSICRKPLRFTPSTIW